jgi:hypothetical protein
LQVALQREGVVVGFADVTLRKVGFFFLSLPQL